MKVLACKQHMLLFEDSDSDIPVAIKCLKCNFLSYNERDISERYCGYCNKFHEKEETK